MNGVPFSDFGDFTNHCLAHFRNRPAFVAAFEKQNYLVVDEWFGGNRYNVQGGNQIEGRVVLGHNGSARMVRPMQVTPRNHGDNFRKYTSPWVTAQGEVNYDEQIASSMSGDAELVDYMEGQFFVGIQSNLELLENQGFAIPDDANDDLNARGVFYWVNFANAGTTDYTGGFNGQTAIWGDGTTTTTIGGIDKSTQALWRNYTVNYTGTLDAIALDALERGLIFTGFQPPKQVSQYHKNLRVKRRIYWSMSNEAAYQRLRNAGSDDRNGDVRPFGFMGTKNFSGVETAGMATLEGHAHSPIVCLDLTTFQPCVKRGWFLRRSKAMNDIDQHNFYTVFLDSQFNFICDMPRNNIVMHVPIAA